MKRQEKRFSTKGWNDYLFKHSWKNYFVLETHHHYGFRGLTSFTRNVEQMNMCMSALTSNWSVIFGYRKEIDDVFLYQRK